MPVKRYRMLRGWVHEGRFRLWALIAMALFVLGGSYAIGQTWQLAQDVHDTQQASNHQQEQIIGLTRSALEASESNRRTLCAAGNIVSANPLYRLPGEKTSRYARRVHSYRTFLRLLRGIDCHAVLLAIQHREQRQRAAAASSSAPPPASTPGTSVPAPSAPAGAGGGSPGNPARPPAARAPRAPQAPQGRPQPPSPESPGNSGLCDRLPLVPVCDALGLRGD